MGQRPMSQRADAMKQVIDLAQTDELLLRPLSAKLLAPTLPEKEGWVDREKLLDIQGRNREVQMRMAEEMGLKDYESPGGGCLLTDENFSNKIREFIAHDDAFGIEDIAVLKYGRHFRLPNGAKLIVGRHKEDNEAIERINNPKFVTLRLPIAGPYSLISSDASHEDKTLASKIAITYAKSSVDEEYEIVINGKERFNLSPFESKAEIAPYFFNAQ